MSLFVIALVAMLNAFSCHHDWHAHIEKTQSDECVYVTVQWWRYQNASAGGRFDIELRGCD